MKFSEENATGIGLIQQKVVVKYISNDQGPENLALISPQRGGVYLRLRLE